MDPGGFVLFHAFLHGFTGGVLPFRGFLVS